MSPRISALRASYRNLYFLVSNSFFSGDKTRQPPYFRPVDQNEELRISRHFRHLAGRRDAASRRIERQKRPPRHFRISFERVFGGKYAVIAMSPFPRGGFCRDSSEQIGQFTPRSLEFRVVGEWQVGRERGVLRELQIHVRRSTKTLQRRSAGASSVRSSPITHPVRRGARFRLFIPGQSAPRGFRRAQ